MRAAVVTFPGSNCDQDCVRAVELAGGAARLVWHRDASLDDADVVIIPGGFAHGDYLRPGAIARFSPVMEAVAAFARAGGLVAGICNGFQALCEAGLLPGALLRNRSLRFQSHDCRLRVERTDTPFTSAYANGSPSAAHDHLPAPPDRRRQSRSCAPMHDRLHGGASPAGQDRSGAAARDPGRRRVLRMPLAHADGAYYADPETLAALEAGGRVVFRYCDASGMAGEEANPNGSLNQIAGIVSEQGNVLGMMPHPDRAVEALLGSADGLPFFTSIVANTRRAPAAKPAVSAPSPKADAAPRPRPGDPQVTPELVAEHGLSPSERQQIRRILGREPTFTELGIFSAMWSEHCGYKNSKRLLRLLPTSAPWVVQGPGENAGVVDVGDGFALAFKIESHNHPSAVEPYQGAATGVGGILRDIFTMGARPVATLNSLRFGDLDSARSRYLFAGVVKGIGDYGNCVGIPCIGGEVHFDRGYADNPLVNAMCLGLLKREDLIRGTAEGVGNTLMAVGARTGRDGIHGATFASEELSADQEEASRPQVQVGDPFTEKLLLEASLELIGGGCIVGIQDMGAAGLTSSGAEMAGRAGNGVEIDVSSVPVREPGMTPYEILLSESQERMLVVARAGSEDAVRAVLEKWELEAAVVGRVTGDGRFRVLENGRVVADVPVLPLTEGCPVYEREGAESPEARSRRTADLAGYAAASNTSLEDAFWAVLSSPNVASKRWVYEQYDSTVRAATVQRPGGDAGVVRIPGGARGIAATVDCNGRFTWLNPRSGAMGAVAEAARNLVCAGARPLAVTNNLNFGSPLKPDVYWQFREAVLGLRDACAFFETPVTGGNVSFYNETDGRPVYPTPVVGMIGLVEDLDAMLAPRFRNDGDPIVLLGANKGELGGSEYLYRVHGVVEGEPPAVDLPGERALQRALLAMSRRRLLASAHDVSCGGLAAALAQSCLGPGAPGGAVVGATVRLSSPSLADAALLFGEDHGRVVASCPPGALAATLETAAELGVPAAVVGTVGGAALRIETDSATLDLPADRLAREYFGAIPGVMDRGEATA